MVYYNIHSHRVEDRADIVTILNLTQREFNNRLEDYKANVYFSAGLHPWYITSNYQSDIQNLKELLDQKKLLAIGEAGLDKLIDVPMELQIKVFEEQIAIAEAYQKPMIIHCVKAWDELLMLHKKWNPQESWIVHGFRGKKQHAEQLQKHGLFLSIGANYNKDSILCMDKSKILLETDDSDLSITDVYEMISLDLNLELERFSGLIRQNVSKILKIALY